MIKTKSILVLLTTLLLTACANHPSHVIVSPVLLHKPQNQFVNKQASLEVTDLRTSNHVVQILKEGEAAQLFSSQKQLKEVIQKSVSEAFEKQGLTLNSQSENVIHLYIEQAQTSVNQSFTKYSAQNNISLKIKVENSQQTLTKTFSSKGTSNGPLTPDMAVLERDLNQQLGNLISQVVQSHEIQGFIK